MFARSPDFVMWTTSVLSRPFGRRKEHPHADHCDPDGRSEGRRFAEAGYTFPKPLIEIDRRPMIELVVDNLRPTEPHQFVFVCRKDHVDQYSLMDVLKQISPGCRVVTMGGPTGGALCSVLLGLQAQDSSKELIVANADQIMIFRSLSFWRMPENVRRMARSSFFPSTHPKWSYVRLGKRLVVAAAERSGRSVLTPLLAFIIFNASVSSRSVLNPCY